MKLTMKEREDRILFEAYGMERFTISQVANAAGGPALHDQTSRLIRAKLKAGEIIEVNPGKNPRKYSWAPDV